jgi:hypothetical protein
MEYKKLTSEKRNAKLVVGLIYMYYQERQKHKCGGFITNASSQSPQNVALADPVYAMFQPIIRGFSRYVRGLLCRWSGHLSIGGIFKKIIGVKSVFYFL